MMREQVPMADYTTWRCGGPAEVLFVPTSRIELCAYLAQLEAGMPVTWLGRGSNLLVRDGGIRGVVIYLKEALDEIRIAGLEATAQAGALCARLAAQTARAGLRGLEFLAGIPGTIGGALAMNAGAADSEIWDRVRSIETVDRHGDCHLWTPEQIDTGYRFAAIPEGQGVLSGTFLLEQDADASAPRERIRTLMEQRRKTQPVAEASGGSVFRNPHPQYAAQLIEAAGLKGHQIGGAQVSPTHANFIVNVHQASSTDIEQLIEHIQREVEAHSGVRLEMEVRILGERG